MAKIKHLENIDVLLLCGGLGKRLRSITGNKPKPMVEICGKPFLDILIGYIASFGFRRFILCTGYKSQLIKKHYDSADGNLNIVFSHEPKPLGTAGAVKNAQPLIRNSEFLVLNADSFCRIDFNKLLEFHREKNALATLALTRNASGQDYGSISIDGNGKVNNFQEKSAVKGKSLVNAGIYVFEKRILRFIPGNRKFSMEYDLFPGLSGKNLYGYIIKNSFIDIGTPERYQKARKTLKKMLCA
jgi:D-glycero-alpha-D-manno-heptose 1-phosphate guanylyltransferase